MNHDAYMTNLDVQQGEPTVRKSTRASANIKARVQPTVPPEERVDEGPIPIPEHAQPVSGTVTSNPDALRDKSPRSMGEKIKR